jgi:cell division septation protein DedD
LLIGALAVVPAYGKPLQLEEARQLELAGDDAAAARLYLSWARERAGDPASLAGYAGFLRTERGLDEIVDACRDLARSLPRVPGAWPLIDETARLFELAGLDDEAAELSMEAWSRGGPVQLLQRSMRLFLSMGDLDAYAAAAAKTVAVPELDPLASAAERIAGRIDEARRDSDRLLSVAEDPSVRLSAAWNLFEAARMDGTPTELAEAAARLSGLFPGSPEAAIARAAVEGTASRVLEAPTPALFLMTAAASPAVDANVPVVTPQPATSPEKTYSVQAGAFKVRENADELAKDLTRAGFEPIVRESAAEGISLWKVFAATGLDRDAATRFIAQLRAAGFAGIATAD